MHSISSSLSLLGDFLYCEGKKKSIETLKRHWGGVCEHLNFSIKREKERAGLRIFISFFVFSCRNFSVFFCFLFVQVSRSFFSGLLVISSPRMVAISPCIKAHGTLEPAKGHFSPLGQ